MITAAGAMERSGLETMEAIRDGVLPLPPIAMLTQFEIRSLEEGRVEFPCTLDESVYNPTAVGRVTRPERRVAFAEGEILDARGRSVATASSSLLVFPVPAS